MPRNVITFPDPVCVGDSLSQVGIWQAPTRKPCGAHGFYADPCQAWNRQNHCAYDGPYFEPVCVGADTPPEPPCQNELAITFAALEGGSAITMTEFSVNILPGGVCFTFPVSVAIAGPATGAEVAQAFADGFEPFGGLGAVEGDTWILRGTQLDDCCDAAETAFVEINGANIPPELYTFELNCCPDLPPEPGPCTEIGLAVLFPNLPSGQSGTWSGLTIGNGESNCFDPTWEPELLEGPLTGTQLAALFDTKVGAAFGAADGDRFVFDLDNISCCDLSGTLSVSITWVGEPAFTPILEDCCDYDPTPSEACEPGDQPNTVRWKFRFTEPPGVVWGARPLCVCGVFDNGTGLPGPEPNTYPDFTAKLIFPGDLLNYYNNDRLRTSIQAGCYPNFAAFAAGILAVMDGSTPCAGLGSCYTSPSNLISASLTMISPTVAEYELFYVLSNMLACEPTICTNPRGWQFARSDRYPDQSPRPGTPAVTPITYTPIINFRCCEFTPEPPNPPDPPGFCEHDCPPAPRRICDNAPDLLRFHFQMPDDLNNWADGGIRNAGWTQTGAPWLATVWVHSEDCCTPPWELMAEAYAVGSFNRGRQVLQNIHLNPEFLPQRFYLQFVFNNAANETFSLYTDYYERMCCPEETAYLEWNYPNLDCEGQFYGAPEEWLGTEALAFQPAMRVRGALIQTGYSIEREEENNRTTRINTRPQFRLRTEYLPPYMIDRLRLALAAPTLTINGIRMEFSGELVRSTLKGQGGKITVDLEGLECSTGNLC
jgi:hypothetical protein